MRIPFQLPPEQAHFASELERAIVDELYKRAWAAFATLLLVLAVTASVLREAIQLRPSIGRVLMLMVAVTLFRTLSLVLLRNVPSPRLRLWGFITGSTLIAFGFADLNIISYPDLAPSEVALLGIIDAGICSGALISMGSSFLSYMLYVVPNIGSLALMVALGPSTRWTHNFLLLLCIYLSALILLAFELARAHQREVVMRLEIAEMALRDNLTQLRNRRALLEFMSLETEQVLRSWRSTPDPAHPKIASSLGVLMLDVDHFKAVNDTYGHVAGDAVLKEIAAILTETTRKPDMVVRWGGEEFVIVARDTDRKPPSRLAERIRERVEQHIFNLPSGQTIQVTCSIGYSLFPFDHMQPDLLTWEQIISVADNGMYFAKTHGRNRSVGVMAGDRIPADSDVLNCLEQGLEQAETEGVVRLVV
ncbi:MAG: diguanylate cyclase [Holophagaceae bacterium]|nr:diguanylate cyclase [Holophagaceae bacterium]